MQSRLIQSVIRHAEQSAYREQYRNQSDAELFRAFHADKDHCAFAGLVRRHGPMVWSVCQNLLRSEANAEDAFQATFLALVRAKGSIRNAAALGGWLHRVAVQVCQRAQRDKSRRLKRESAAAKPESVKPNPDREWRELHERVHREIDQLPDKQRTAFVLCCLEGVRPVDAAKQLGMKVNTLTSLLTRARQQMLGRLKESGQIAGLLTGVAVLAGSPNSFAVPSSLMDKVFLFAQSDVTTGVSSIVLNLAHAATEVPMVRFKILAAMLLIGTALTAGVGGTILSHSYADDPFAQSKVPQDVKKANPQAGVKQAQDELLLLKEKAKLANELAQAYEQALLENNKAVAANGWDYKVVPLTDPQDELTKLGNDGWELVTIDRVPTELPISRPIAYLKRKKEQKVFNTVPKKTVIADSDKLSKECAEAFINELLDNKVDDAIKLCATPFREPDEGKKIETLDGLRKKIRGLKQGTEIKVGNVLTIAKYNEASNVIDGKELTAEQIKEYEEYMGKDGRIVMLDVKHMGQEPRDGQRPYLLIRVKDGKAQVVGIAGR